MPDDIKPADTQTATTTTNTTNVAQTPPEAQGDPQWLNKRLERAAETANKKMLQDLGVSSVDDLKGIVKAAKDAAESTKSLTDKYADTTKTLSTIQQQFEEANAVIKARAESEFASLTAEQQAAVTALAGDNHAARLKAITALSPTWVKPAAAPAEVTKTVPAPANTAPNVQKPTATPPAPPAADDAAKLSTYENLQKTNPVAAAGYMLQNFQALQRARGVS